MTRFWMGLALATLATPAMADAPSSLEVWPSFDALLRHTSYKPSQQTLDALAREGARFDPKAPAFVQQAPRLDMAAPPLVKIHGEIAVLEGDAEIVSDLGDGNYGLRYDNRRQDPMRVARRLLGELGDQYDFILVWTSFWDAGADGLAYYVPIRSLTEGIGLANFDTGRAWGSESKLEGFLNMKTIESYGNVANPNNYVYPVVGQELTHRWLAGMTINNAEGARTRAMLGRDMAHWSSLLQAFGSVQDGNYWQDNEDGTFTVLENMTRYSPLDLYGMGIAPASEVGPFFLIEDALHNGQPVNPAATIPVGATVTGTRRDITIEDVIASNGPRIPSYENERKEWRVALALVTRPGQTIEDVQHELTQIETFRNIWMDKHYEWTQQRSTVCTRLLQDCDSPDVHLSELSLVEHLGDGDGILEPGEHARVVVSVVNQGRQPSSELNLLLDLPEGSPLALVSESSLLAPALAPQERQTLDTAFIVEILPSASCEAQAQVRVSVSNDGQSRTLSAESELGRRTLAYESLSNPLDWTLNPYGTDTATMGFWEIGRPSRVTAEGFVSGLVTQPGMDVDGDNLVLVTGASRRGGLGGNDLDDGITTILSPIYDMAGASDPWLSYASWHAAFNFNAPEGSPLDELNDALTVELSGDGGQSWVLVDRDITNTQSWEHKRVRLREVFVHLPETLRIRFIARDLEPASLSEAAIDAIRIWESEPTCFGAPFVPPEDTDTDTDTDSETDTDGWGFGGRIDSGCQSGPWASLALLGLGLLAWRRRHLGRQAH